MQDVNRGWGARGKLGRSGRGKRKGNVQVEFASSVVGEYDSLYAVFIGLFRVLHIGLG